MKDLSILGIFVADLAFFGKIPKVGETILGKEFVVGPGGKGSNQSVAAGKAGASVEFITKIGNDDYGKMALKTYKETNVGTGMVGAPACGDVMKLQIKCEPKGNTHIIKDVKFKTYGCGSAIASASELVDMLIGKTLEEAKAIKNVEIVEALELPPIKIHCSVLAEDSIRQAIEDYESKQ